MSKREDIHKILVIGSGPIIIGQACEFDYSGTQAIKALKEDGYYVILVNPNPATMMSTPSLSDKVYMEPLTVEYLEEIIRVERPDAILSTVGGQSGLNLTLALDKEGILLKYNVEVLGASIESINKAEDRGLFKELVESLNLESPKSVVVHTLEEAIKAKESIPFPIIIRPSFTLGGRGGAIAYNDDSYIALTTRALKESPVSEVLIEESLIGWKEFEMEVMRDKSDNAIIVCSIENIDPMGVHTGDSITIAPIQTLDNSEYQDMRDASINILRAVGVDCGGSNVQFALNPKTKKMVVIEMNPRVSRSSALASKATGFPIAFCSTKLALGYTLDEVVNQITGKSVSCFEPALDYCAVKVPRFELEKFPLKPSALGSQMRSVGEALSIGRSAIEALNKSLRATERKLEGLQTLEDCDVQQYLTNAHPLRILAIYTVLFNEGESSMEELSKVTGFDRWFIYQLYKQSLLDHELIDSKELSKELLEKAKEYGMSDKRISTLRGCLVEDIINLREKYNLHISSHFVDTCAGEFKALTPYMYNTYGEVDEGEPFGEEAIVILASGPNRIGQGLEFDTCCSLSSTAYRELGKKTIIINSNPETVSTDYNVSDRLYIEPLDAETVKEILVKEKAKKLVIQLGGQTPLNIAKALSNDPSIEIIGTSLKGIDAAEDRGDFASILNELNLNQAANRMGSTMDEIHSCAKEIGYPILLRPSFVLGGRSMFIAYSEEDIDSYFENNAISFDKDHPILIDQFLEDAFEYDLDAISDGEDIYIGGILQHIEAAGIHSGDSAAVFPPYKSSESILEEMRVAALKIARKMNLIGFLNIQFAVKDETLYIIEVNPRASRTVPFISKYSKVDLIKAAVRVWEGISLKEQGLVAEYTNIGEGKCHSTWAIKEAVFSFDRFVDIDPLLGPEMRSTGETTGSGKTFGEAYAKSQISSGNNLPTSGKVLISVNKKDRETILPVAKELVELGFEIAATPGSARYLFENGILCEVMLKVNSGHPNIVDNLSNKRIDLVINTPMGFHSISSNDDIRSVALLQKIPYTTTTSAAIAAVEGIKYLLKKEAKVSPIYNFIN
jgi:carbamoyl-phosphate synthase large subunit